MSVLVAAEREGRLHPPFGVGCILGRLERGAARAHDETLLRLLTPIAKLTTGKATVAVTSEALECFGGAGYVEDTGLPVMLRDGATRELWSWVANARDSPSTRPTKTLNSKRETSSA